MQSDRSTRRLVRGAAFIVMLVTLLFVPIVGTTAPPRARIHKCRLWLPVGRFWPSDFGFDNQPGFS